MQMQKDYYQILGVPKVATPADVKRAFHGQCMRFYPGPERNADPDLEKHFAEVAEAYQVLSSDRERAFYDHLGFKRFREGIIDKFGNRLAGFQTPKPWRQVYLEFCGENEHYSSQCFEKDNFASYVSPNTRQAKFVPKNIEVEVPLKLAELLTGKTVDIQYSKTVLANDGIRTEVRPTRK